MSMSSSLASTLQTGHLPFLPTHSDTHSQQNACPHGGQEGED
eukprot:CAMPEP_0182471880 /NCGR_PEP_ID=MMETSP1319-20130603/21153_1 /TAXON_ID=172717 /ORGANISM="Bolidomonas pacifica, Strain RCC208" /LENGTH=41 /DNA_ID= /DNA_START= /DNA_END= /DNA_ORIENTATION=